MNLSFFRERNAWLIFVSQLVSSISEKMLSIGLIWYITKNLGANFVAWFLTCAFLPHLLLTFYSSRVIQSWGILKTIKITTVFRSLILLICFLLLNLIKIHSN